MVHYSPARLMSPTTSSRTLFGSRWNLRKRYWLISRPFSLFPTGWSRRVSAAASFYAAFRPLFRLALASSPGIPSGQRREFGLGSQKAP
jgi:hypothetical protein